MRIIFSVIIFLLVSACSNKQVYDAVQANQRSQCSELPPVEYQECRQKEQVSYEQYQEERKKVKKY